MLSSTAAAAAASSALDWLPLVGLAGVCLSFPLGMQVTNNCRYSVKVKG